MALAFLDTSVINRCYGLGITGCRLQELLAGRGLEPVLGFNTIYELARDFLNTDRARTIGLFSIVRDLKPKIACKRSKIYVMEFNHLKSGSPIEPFASKNELDIFNQRIQDYCNGIFNHEAFVRARQTSWDNIRGNWGKFKEHEFCLMLSKTKLEPGKLYLKPVEGKIAYTIITPNGKIFQDIFTDIQAPIPFDLTKLLLLKKKILEFISKKGHTRESISRGTAFINYRNKEISGNVYLRPGLKQMLSLMTGRILNLEDEDISLIMDNLDKCPAIRGFIYSQLYQEYILAVHGNVPAEDRFTDSLQLIEASCCSEYITGDEKHLKCAKWINPSLEYKLIDNVVHLS